MRRRRQRGRRSSLLSAPVIPVPSPPAEDPPLPRPDPPPFPTRPKRPAPRPDPPPPPLHQTLKQEEKTRKRTPARVREHLAAAERGAASGAPAESGTSNLAPHPQADQGREPPITEDQRRRRDAPGSQYLERARHQVFRIGKDWHGVLDKNLNNFGVFDNRTAELVADLNTRDLPIEFAIVSFALEIVGIEVYHLLVTALYS